MKNTFESIFRLSIMSPLATLANFLGTGNMGIPVLYHPSSHASQGFNVFANYQWIVLAWYVPKSKIVNQQGLATSTNR